MWFTKTIISCELQTHFLSPGIYVDDGCYELLRFNLNQYFYYDIDRPIIKLQLKLVQLTPNHCKMLTTDDYKSLIFTTFGEMVGIPLLLFFALTFRSSNDLFN